MAMLTFKQSTTRPEITSEKLRIEDLTIAKSSITESNSKR